MQLNSIDGDHHNGKQSCRNISRANLQFLYPENMNVYETNNTVKNKIHGIVMENCNCKNCGIVRKTMDCND